MSDTICAISTPHGSGAIALIRRSGTEAISVADSVFRPRRSDSSLALRPSHTLTYGSVVDDDGCLVDDVLVSVFRAPRSFTGEDVVEIAMHGSSYVQQEVLRLLCAHGARLATAGEFSRRAFANGKIDLTQAEAIADVIASESKTSHRIAMSHMKGQISECLNKLHGRLVELSALLELELDFSEEDVEFADRAKLLDLSRQLQDELTRLTGSFKYGNAIKNGIPVTIAGSTNVGKSTLLNAIVGEERAIVSDIHGTTRDSIEALVNIDGILFRFIDTAGLRPTTDTIEQLGIERTRQHIKKAFIVLYLIDATEIGEGGTVEHDNIIYVINKIDVVSRDRQAALLKKYGDNAVAISAKYGTNIQQLTDKLLRMSHLADNSDIIITNERHYQNLCQARDSISRVIDGLAAGIPSDLVAQDLRACNQYIGEITGEITSESILHTVFSRFCIGK